MSERQFSCEVAVTMKNQANIKDPVISQKINNKLSSLGIRAPCHVTVASKEGSVTLSGITQYEHQRHAAVRAIKGVAGVQRVVDQMQVLPSGQRWNANFKR
jgi:osmotically-inducible protein OsmY